LGFINCLEYFLGRYGSLEAEVVVVGARHAGPAVRINSLIHVHFHLSPADDSELRGEEAT